MKKRFILSHHRAPGDLTCLTALVRDIYLTYEGQVQIDVDTTVGPIWENNPYLTKLWNHDKDKPRVIHPGTQFIQADYKPGLTEQKYECLHFCSYFHRDFKKKTGLTVPLIHPHGDIHLSDKERAERPVPHKYWLVVAGGKSDFPIKVWHTDYFQQVVDGLGEQGLRFAQTGAIKKGHWHPRLRGDHVTDLVGVGGIREFIQQIYHAEGVICGVTGAMHMAAAMGKPCVVIAGGREAWWWEAYVHENKGLQTAVHSLPMPHRFLHTIGLLDCCEHHGCWRNKVVQINKDKSLCRRPIVTPAMPIAECMHMITPRHVMDAVMSYYKDGSLPPIEVTDADKSLMQEITKNTIKTQGSIVIPTGMPIKINPTARIRTAEKPQEEIEPFKLDEIYDHEAIGGSYTAFVLLYGGEEYFDLHRRCLASLIATTPRHRIEIRVGSNALNPKSANMVNAYVDQGLIAVHYAHDTNDYKYPVMREMFFDTVRPIKSKWVLWFDDDSFCDVDNDWLGKLTQHIIQSPGHDMVGAKLLWTPNKKQREILEAAAWHRGRPWRTQRGEGSPNGNKIIFATGGFWAITKKAIVQADIPDLRTGLTHNGGDWQIGEQLYQAGFKLKHFNGEKQFVRTSAHPRRGITAPLIDKTTQPAATDLLKIPPLVW